MAELDGVIRWIMNDSILHSGGILVGCVSVLAAAAPRRTERARLRRLLLAASMSF
jgi:hypothetical protein